MAKSKSYGGFIVLLLVFAAAGAGAWFYFRNQGTKEPEYLTMKVTRGDITQSVTATGDLQPVKIVDIGAQVSGQIKEVLVDFNSQVKAGDVLAKIDPATPTQRLNQALADLESAKASNQLIQINVARTRELFEKKLVSQQELDSAEAQLAQSKAQLLTRHAAVENARLDLARCTITAPMDGIVLDRKTDVGRTVNASMNAPTLFTLVNDLTKMQINAAVAEADVGLIKEGQPVRFTVDAFPNLTFNGSVRQVRNAATANQSVVSYATIIDVANDELRLKPGMTANVSIIVAEKQNVLRVGNQALRVRIPAELQSKVVTHAAPPAKEAAAAAKERAPKDGAAVAANLTDDERRRAMFEIMREAGFQKGAPPTPEVVEKAKSLAKDKGIDPEMIGAQLNRLAAGGGRRGGGGGRGGGPDTGDRGFNNTVIERVVYKLVGDINAPEKKMESTRARLGISDGINTEVIEGLAEGDVVLTGITLPGAQPTLQPQSGGMNNPFQSRSSFGGGSMGGGGSGMRRGG